MKDLFQKYDVPGPRYTSYPTVPYWDETPARDYYLSDIRETVADPGASWSVYMHLPYCETRCWFCACNAIGTRDHQREANYVQAIHDELANYLYQVPGLKKKPLKQIHLGGGTPTFFSAANLDLLLSPLEKDLCMDREAFDGSVEVNPKYVSEDQLKVFRRHGFKRISLGIQDFDPDVQKVVHREQPKQVSAELVRRCRELGFEGVNFDLIYGLPLQSAETVRATAASTIALRPDRIALYSFAVVPWVQPAHKKLADSAPKGKEKRELYEICREAFIKAGYLEIGMDHFALPTDSLAEAARNGGLHRNFMGYTHTRTELLIGLGVSAISESPGCYHQNVKEVEPYIAAVSEGRLATHRGHKMTDEDRARRRQILSLMTRFEVELEGDSQAEEVAACLAPLIEDGLATVSEGRLRLTDKGRPFLRNACMAFDVRMRRKQPETRIFSQTV